MIPQKNQLKKIHVRQLGEHACGLACLSALTNFYGGSIPQEKLRQVSGTTLNGTSLLGLYQAACKIGFTAKGYEGNIKDLKTLDNPVILHVVTQTNRQHFIVCYGHENGKFIIGDPGWGITHYSDSELEAIWQSRALLSLVPNEKFLTITNIQQGQWEWFKSLIKEDIPILTVAAVLGLLMAVTGLSTAIFSQKLIDDFLPNNDVRKIIIGLATLALLLCIRAFLGYIQGIFMARQGKNLNVRIVKSFIDKIVQLPISYFRGYSTGDLIARMNDSMRIRDTVAVFTGSVVINILVVCVSLGYIFVQSLPMGLLSVSGIVFFFLIAWRFHKPIHELQKDVMVAHSANESQYIDALTGISTVKSFGREGIFKDRINTVYDMYQTKGYDLAILGNRFGFLTQLTVGVYLSLMFAYGVWMVVHGQLLLGELMALLTIGSTIIPSIASLAIANIQLQEAKVAFDRMFEISSLEKEFESLEKENLVYSEPDRASVLRLQSIAYRFPGKSPVLKNIGFQVSSEEIISVFGQVGSGKSTLAELIQGLYSPESGTMELDGKGIQEWTLPIWRAKIAVVAQSEKIFNSTLLDNICLSNDFGKLQECIAFCQYIGLDPLFSQLPQGYLTLCGEEGRNLSGGQKQLVAIARALYKQPSFLLLDESTSAMDFETENQVLGILREFSKKNKVGIIMITHRIGLAKRTDRILTLKDGVVGDSGPHAELITRENDYAKAFEHLTLSNTF